MARFWEGFHSSHIHSLSLKSDQEIFLSSCQLMVNSLFVERPGVCQTLVESKSVNSAVITSAAFNPGSTDEFVFSTNTGALQLCDHRQGKDCTSGQKVLHQGRDDNDRSPFKEVLKSTNCVRFSPCGQYLASRDFGTVKIFDKRMEDKAVSVFAVHDWLFPWPQRKELYKAESMFDRFDVNWSGDGRHIVTGSYGYMFRVFNVETMTEQTIETYDEENPQRKIIVRKTSPALAADEVKVEDLDVTSGALRTAFHPKEGTVAVAFNSAVHVLRGSKGQTGLKL